MVPTFINTHSVHNVVSKSSPNYQESNSEILRYSTKAASFLLAHIQIQVDLYSLLPQLYHHIKCTMQVLESPRKLEEMTSVSPVEAA